MGFATSRTIRTFLASPGDLEVERRVTRQVTEEVNSIVREIDWHVELLGWEDTLPGFVRPQDAINRDVDSCDLFMGLLWRRWGTPTGKSTSGFYEEFERARKRRRRETSPEIWLFFKKVDPAQVDDAGDQLRQVLLFRKDQIKRREVLFKEFETEESWRDLFRESLLRYILRLTQEAAPSTRLPPEGLSLESSIPSERVGSGTEPVTTVDLARKQVEDVLGQVASDVRAGQGGTGAGQFEVIRLTLLTRSLMALRYPSELPDSHDVNKLYRFRAQLHFAPIEADLLLRTLVADRHEIIPGWYWLREVEADKLAEILVTIARDDSVLDARSGALIILRLGMLRPRGGPYGQPATLVAILLDQPEEVRVHALTYLGALAAEERWDLSVETLKGFDLEAKAEFVQAWLEVQTRNDAAGALAYILEHGVDPSNAVLQKLRAHEDAFPDNLLGSALTYNFKNVRALAAHALQRRGSLSNERADRLIKDQEVDIRELGVRELLHRGEDIAPERVVELLGPIRSRVVLPEVLGRLSEASLIDMTKDWLSLAAPAAYQVLATKSIKDFENRAREDLRDRFQGFEREAMMRLERQTAKDALEKMGIPGGEEIFAQLGDAVQAILKERTAGVKGYVRSAFVAAALTGLASHPQPSDGVIARAYLGDLESDIAEWKDTVRIGAIRLLEQTGDSSDVQLLFRVAQESYGEVKDAAIRTALKLAPGPEGAAQQALASSEYRQIELALADLTGNLATVPKAIALLSHEDSAIRKLIISYLFKNCSEGQLEDILQNYLSSRAYYYNVVCLLDRGLHAPAPLNAAFRENLTI